MSPDSLPAFYRVLWARADMAGSRSARRASRASADALAARLRAARYDVRVVPIYPRKGER